MLKKLVERRAARMSGSEGGFSLVELVVVVAVIGILVALAVPRFNKIQDNAKDKSAQNSLKASQTQIIDLMGDESNYELLDTGTYLLSSIDGDVTYGVGTASTGPKAVDVEISTTGVTETSYVRLAVQSKSGTCFGLRMNASQAGAGSNKGATEYGKIDNSATCTPATITAWTNTSW